MAEKKENLKFIGNKFKKRITRLEDLPPDYFGTPRGPRDRAKDTRTKYHDSAPTPDGRDDPSRAGRPFNARHLDERLDRADLPSLMDKSLEGTCLDCDEKIASDDWVVLGDCNGIAQTICFACLAGRLKEHLNG